MFNSNKSSHRNNQIGRLFSRNGFFEDHEENMTCGLCSDAQHFEPLWDV